MFSPVFDNLKEAVLVKFYSQAIARHDSGAVYFDKMDDIAPNNISDTYLYEILDELFNDGSIKKITERPDRNGFFISKQGIKEVESRIRDRSSLSYLYWAEGDAAFSEDIEEGIEYDAKGDGVADPVSLEIKDTWEPLPLERHSKKFDEAVSATESALREIEGNNGYAESAPEERDRVVWSLKEGLKHMREGLPSRDQVIAYALKPLKFVAEKFAGASMGEMAKAAVKALLAWLGDG